LNKPVVLAVTVQPFCTKYKLQSINRWQWTTLAMRYRSQPTM